jgi:threonine dehydrogenase-like Zn-dependent dehydrogenase
VARLLAGIPGVQVTLIDVDEGRAATAASLGVRFATPADAPGALDLVVHTSATGEGLQLAVELLGDEGTVLEMSWYGDRAVPVALGGAFHARRLRIVASQVGAVAVARRTRRSTRDRLELALSLLRDDVFDALLSGRSPFEELPDVMAALAAGRPALCHTIDYPSDAREPSGQEG